VSLHDLLHGEVLEPTWSPLNSLNIGGPHKHCPPQRIDHVFLRAKDIECARITPISSEVCLTAPVVPIDHRQKVSVSDHYGLFTELEIAPSPRPPDAAT
jgi:endonuclease/exonuclease/phosphatase family metal-dependent hydrolase